MYKQITFFVIFFLSSTIMAQHPTSTPAVNRLLAKTKRDSLKTHSLVKNLPFRSIGPTVMSGRVVDIEGDPSNPNHFFVAYASGGLWESKSNGISFEPLFDNQDVMTIGDIAVDWNHENIIWVGTGENNSSRSSYSGTGIYRSNDSGKTWQHKGLAESHHIGRIVIHPKNPNIVWVAAIGHLYSPNPQRGVFKTIDGGTTWQKVLYIDQHTGAIDLVIDPQNPDILYAATWERERKAWNLKESGIGSGIYKSTDGGQNWQKISTKESGFPVGEGVGRIGLAISANQPEILYALVDNQFHRPQEKKHALTKDMLREMKPEEFLKIKVDDIHDYLDRYQFPKEFNADTLFLLIKQHKITPLTLVEYLEDANSLLFDTPVVGAELYRSDDGGISWKRTHEDYLDQMYYTFGYYFGNVRISPLDPDEVYLLGVPFIHSEDGGQTFQSINSENVHVDHHALWQNPKNPDHLILGNDGGINISFDNGKIWQKTNSLPVGQFYTVAVDMARPFNVYGGLQDNGVWVGPGKHRESRYWQSSGKYPYSSILGGDGMQIAIDNRDNNTIYTGYQFGNYYCIDRQKGTKTYITPKHKLSERPMRFNWQTPIHLSVHNQDILYLGSQKLHRSMNQGQDWHAISADLTKGGKKGDVPYGTLTSIHESPLQFGLIYCGSDDGLIHLTKDGGHLWTCISDGLPQDFWVSRVQASAFDTATVYIALNGYRWDNFEALIFMSDDFGNNWRQIGTDLPAEPVNVIKEDPTNPNLIYVGTDHGIYLSLDKGKSFMAFENGLPDAPVHDFVIHPRDSELLVATHGRSLFSADVSLLQKLDTQIRQEVLHIFPIKKVRYSANWGNRNYSWNFTKGPERQISYYARKQGECTISLFSEKGKLLWQKTQSANIGLNFFESKFTVNEKAYRTALKAVDKKDRPKEIKAADDGQFYLPGGKYKVEIRLNGTKKAESLLIELTKKESRKKKKKTP